MNRQRMCALLALCGCLGPLVIQPGCSSTAGYRDQFSHALSAPQENRGAPGITQDAVRLEEWLSAYSYPLPPASQPQLFAGLATSSAGRASGQGWLLVALKAPDIAPEAQQPRRWVFVLDQGDGMKGTRWRLAIRAVIRLAATLRDIDRVCIAEAGGDRPPMQNTGWLTPTQATKTLLNRMNSPAGGFQDDASLTKFDPDFHKPFSSLPKTDTPFDQAAFFFTDGTGSEKRELKGTASSVRIEYDAINMSQRSRVERSIPDHIIGLAGGDETSLRTLARAANGSFIYLASDADIERQIGASHRRFFDTSLHGAAVNLTDSTGQPVSFRGAVYSDVYGIRQCGGCCAWQPPRNPWVNLRGAIGRMGPGETWVRLYPISLSQSQTYTQSSITLTAIDPFNKPVRLTTPVSTAPLNPEAPISPLDKTLCKALAIQAQVELLREVTARKETINLPIEAARIRDIIRTAQTHLHDPELARDLTEWEAIARLTPQDIQRLRKELSVRLSPTQQLARAAKIGGVASAITIAGVVIAPVGIPYLIISEIAR